MNKKAVKKWCVWFWFTREKGFREEPAILDTKKDVMDFLRDFEKDCVGFKVAKVSFDGSGKNLVELGKSL